MAIGVAAAIGGASVLSGVLGSSASKNAASTQSSASTYAAQLSYEQYQQNAQKLAPWVSSGSAANTELSGLLGLPGYSGGTGGGTYAAYGDSAGGQGNTQAVPAGSTLSKYTGSDAASSGIAYVLNDSNGTPIGYYNNTGGILMGQYAFPGANNVGQTFSAGQIPGQTMTSTSTNYGGGLSSGSLLTEFNPTMSQLQQTPGYQFTLQQGEQAVQNAAAAEGLGQSGAALKGASSYAEGLASTTYQQQFQNYWTQLSNIYNMLSGASSTGAQAATTTGQFGSSAASSAGNYLTSGAAASASGTIGSASSLSSAASSLSSLPLTYSLLSSLGQNSGNTGTGGASLSGSYTNNLFTGT